MDWGQIWNENGTIEVELIHKRIQSGTIGVRIDRRVAMYGMSSCRRGFRLEVINTEPGSGWLPEWLSIVTRSLTGPLFDLVSVSDFDSFDSDS